jgi:hypothetical protein
LHQYKIYATSDALTEMVQRGKPQRINEENRNNRLNKQRRKNIKGHCKKGR